MNTFSLIPKDLTARFFASVTILSMILTAFPAAFFVAHAATNLYGPDSMTVTTVGGEYSSGTFDASSHKDLVFSFDYDSTKLDGASDSFTYGWRDAGGDNDVDTIDGKVGTDDPSELGSISVSLPAGAQVADLEVYLYVTALPGNESDEVKLTNIVVKGDEIIVPVKKEEKVDICHWHQNGFNSINVSVNSIAGAHGNDTEDIIPVIPNIYPAGQNLAEVYGASTGAEVLANDCVAALDPDPSLVITSPAADGETLSGSYEFLAEYVDEDDVDDAVAWAIRDGVAQCDGNTFAANVGGFSDPYTFDGASFAATVDMSTWADGEYCLVVNPQESGNGEDLREIRTFFLENKKPEPEKAPEVCSYEGSVVSYTDPAHNNSGGLVDANRRLSAAVEAGVAPYTNFFGKEESAWQVSPLDFFSLGIEGEIVYEFTDKIAVDTAGDDIAVWEITGGPADEQADEMVEVWLSENGLTYELADTIAGDGSVDIADTSLNFVKFVKLVDKSNGIQGVVGDGYDLDAITIINDSCDDYATVHTTKIVCTDEDDLPNWGAGAGGITVSTATNWLTNEHPSCEAVEDWEFEWAPKGISDPGDTLVGTAGSDWATFVGSTMVPASEFTEGYFWMREVLQEGYIGFTHGPEGNKNTDDVSAEMYCASDVLNYDNLDRVDAPQPGEDYYCVAWNVPEEPPQQFGDYCGDGVVNQEWEACDGGYIGYGEGEAEEGICTAQCQYKEQRQCTDLTLAKIDIETVENDGAGNMTDNIFLGQSALAIPNNVWFRIYENGIYEDDADVSGYEDVRGLAVERDSGELRTVMYGSATGDDVEHVEGDIYFWSWDGSVDATGLRSDNSNDFPGNNKLEGEGVPVEDEGSKGGAGDDEVWLDNGEAFFWLTTTVADDGFYTEYSKPVECQTCEADVNLLKNAGFEAPVVSAGNFGIFPTGTPLLEWLTGDEDVEIQNNVAGSPYAGNQHAELDPNHPTMIWQEVDTIPGETYKFSTYYSPRPGRDLEDNRFEFRVNGSALGSSVARSGVGNSDTVWTLESRQFVANSLTTLVGFAETGTDTSHGAYIDDAALSCVPDSQPPVDVCDNLRGNQETLPQGYEFTDEGICELIEEPPVDVCLNLDDVQETLPVGYEFTDEGVCELVSEPIVLGCTDSEATNYNPEATEGNDEAQNCEYDPVPVVLGCTDGSATNYDSSATPGNSEAENCEYEQSGGGGGGSTGTRISDAPTPQVLGASTSQCPFLLDYMQIGIDNDPWEVTKLQAFLNIFVAPTPINGFFGPATDANVKLFQEQYREDILSPWFRLGIVPHTEATGFVYKTTVWKINSIICPDETILPNFDGEDLSSNINID